MFHPQLTFTSRRSFLRSVSYGFGAVAFTALSQRSVTAESPLAPKQPHFEPRAKRVLMLCMEGGPSQVDSFDYKPELKKLAGKEIGKGKVPKGLLMPSLWEFRQGGESGLWISDLYPEVREHADKLCLIHSMQTDIPAHPPAFIQMHTGISTSPRPSMGAWVLYGLGTENANLPGFVTICAPANNGGSTDFGSAFLPASYQGTKIGTNRQPISRAQIANLKEDHGKHAGATDKPIAGLLTDLAARGLLKDTLVLWGGEFGRTPYGQGGDGRDHNHTGYTTWMAGGGVKGGFQYGATDDFGYEAIADKVHIHDWHATILHLLGLDHERLTFRHAGRDMRLTDVKGRVHEGILS